MMIVDPYKARALAPVARTYIGGTVLSFSATPSASGVAIGTATADRYVFIVVHWFKANPGTALTSATIGGIAATIQAINSSGNGGISVTDGVAIISAPVPTGTTATVALTFGAAATSTIETYSVTGLVSDVPIDTISAAPVNVQPYSDIIDVKAQGILFFAASLFSAAASYSVSGATKDYDAALFSNGIGVGATLLVTADELNRAVSISRVGGTGTTFNAAVAAASFR